MKTRTKLLIGAGAPPVIPCIEKNLKKYHVA